MVQVQDSCLLPHYAYTVYLLFVTKNGGQNDSQNNINNGQK
jgi:hypothetical protein